MKKYFIILLISLFLLSCTEETKVKYLGNAKVQFNNEGYYEFLFTLKDANKNPVRPRAKVSLRIVNDNEEEVYSQQTEISENDYGIWTSPLVGENTYACIRIDENNVNTGLSTKGKLYFTVFNDNYFEFDEMSVPIHNLPVIEPTIKIPKLPVKLNTYSDNYSWDSSYNLIKSQELTSAIEITNIEYKFNKSSSSIEITFLGRKTKSKNKYDSFSFDYRLKDSDGYVSKTGMVFLRDIHDGDKFKKTETVRGLTLGQKYSLEIIKNK